jgi:hypothetical protein
MRRFETLTKDVAVTAVARAGGTRWNTLAHSNKMFSARRPSVRNCPLLSALEEMLRRPTFATSSRSAASWIPGLFSDPISLINNDLNIAPWGVRSPTKLVQF